jgi:hypothetical protein
LLTVRYRGARELHKNGHRLEFRVEFFNALNHAQFNLPNATVNSPSFGTLFRAKDARQVQFGLKLYY